MFADLKTFSLHYHKKIMIILRFSQISDLLKLKNMQAYDTFNHYLYKINILKGPETGITHIHINSPKTKWII